MSHGSHRTTRRCKTRWRRLSIFLCHSLLLIATSRAAEVSQVRTGFHTTYSRIVVQADRPLPYTVDYLPTEGLLKIEMLTFSSPRLLPPIGVEPADVLLEAVQSTRTDSSYILLARLRQNIRFEHQTLNRPFRIVIDLFATLPEPPLQIVEHQPVETLQQADSAKIAVAQTNPNADGTGQLQPAPLIVGTIDSFVARAPSSSTAKKDSSAQASVPSDAGRKSMSSKKRLTLLSLIGVSALILQIAGTTWFVRRRRKRAALSLQTQKRRQPQIQAAADKPSPEFLEFLKSAAEKQEGTASQKNPGDQPNAESTKNDGTEAPYPATAPAGSEKMRKLERLIGSLSDVLGDGTPQSKSGDKVPPPNHPRLDDLAGELKLLDNNTALSDDEARRQLIGRDGIEFMKNIKRLYLNN